MKSFVHLLAFMLFFLPSSILSQSFDPKSVPDKLTLLFLLKGRLYQPLMQKLDEYLKAAQQDVQFENYLWSSFSAFDIPDPALEPYLNEWIQRFPQSSSAYTARALHYMSVGWDIRGYGWASSVSDRQWEATRNYFLQALKDANEGLNLNPQNLICYDTIIKLGMQTGNTSTTRGVLNEALKLSPYSLELRVSYMWSLLPRWGGSHDKMLNFAQESEQYTKQNPQLTVLQGYIPFDQGWDLQYSENYKSAIEFFNKALLHGERALFYEHRGDSYFQLKEYERALEDYERGLQLRPQNADLLRKKGNTLYQLHRAAEAGLAIETASKISPTDERIKKWKEYGSSVEAYDHEKKGYELAHQGRNKEAIQEYDLAIQAKPDNYLAYYNRGVARRDLGLYDEAVKDFEAALSRNRSTAGAHGNIGWVRLNQGRFDEAIEAYSSAINLKADDHNAYLNRSFAYAKKGMIQEATRDLKKSCDLGNQQACQMYQQLKAR